MTVKEIRAKVSSLLMEQRTIALAGFTPESRTKFDKIQKDIESLEADAQHMEVFEARDAESRSFTRSPRPGAANSGNGYGAEEERSRVSKAFQQYALRGSRHAVDAEYRDLLTTSDTTGGALIPQMFSGILVDALKFYGPVAQYVAQKVTDNKGAPMKISFDSDVANGLTLLGTEGSSSPAETDPAFVSKILGVDTVTGGLVKVSFQELEDSSFDLDAFIRDKFSIRYARGLERALTLGVDAASTTLPNQTSGGLMSVASVVDTTASVAAGIGWDDLTSAFTGIDPAYATPASSWMMNSATRGYLVGLKDGFGRPYFTPDPSSDGPFDKLLGFPLIINQSMPNMGANAKPILFGDLSKSYLLRTDGQPSILRLNERYADTLEVGFYMYSRIGGVSLYSGISGAPVPLVAIQQASS
jgi:HK97 family phage major capsid protein